MYSRAQAIADGVLIDVSRLAREAGFRFPVAMTQAVWESCVRVPAGCPGQDETGRLWDVLNVLRWSIAATPTRRGDGEIEFTVSVRQSAEAVIDQDLRALCHPGDDSEPVITILLPNED